MSNSYLLCNIRSCVKGVIKRSSWKLPKRCVHTESKVGVRYEHDFSDSQYQRILQTLNEGSIEQLMTYRIPKNCIDKLSEWRTKNGRFASLGDALHIQGLGVKTLDRICRSIIDADADQAETTTAKSRAPKSRGNILTPTISLGQAKDLGSSVGLHMYATGISCARIERENNTLTDWMFFEYNLGSKKLTPTDALKLVISICNEVPPSDAYIFETPPSVTPTAQQSSVSVSAYVQKVQLLSMLITYLSTSAKHNPKLASELSAENREFVNFQPRVFFLRHRLPARLFQTLIGTERISAANTISNILYKKGTENVNYTPISVASALDSMYNAQIPVNKEVLGQALMLTMAFMDVCVYQNPYSLKAIYSNNR